MISPPPNQICIILIHKVLFSSFILVYFFIIICCIVLLNYNNEFGSEGELNQSSKCPVLLFMHLYYFVFLAVYMDMHCVSHKVQIPIADWYIHTVTKFDLKQGPRFSDNMIFRIAASLTNWSIMIVGFEVKSV